MPIPFTLLFYISRSFIFHLALVTSVIALLCFLGTLTESARRLVEYGVESNAIIVKMALYQTPSILEFAFPFIFLISTISCFFSFAKRGELDAVRTNGISAWVFISPALLIALLSGFFVFSVYNPVSAGLNAQYNELRAIYIKRKPSMLALADTGIWLKQGDKNKHSIVHAARTTAGVLFSDITIFLYQDEDRFIGRLDAKKAKLANGAWQLEKVWITNTSGHSHFVEAYEQPTELTPTHVYDSVAPPQTISFWGLNKFITLAKRAGLAVPAYEFHWYSLMTMPLFLLAMTLFGASATFFFSARQGREAWLITSTLSFGFVIYILLFLGRKIAASPETPILLAASAPIILAMTAGSFLFLQKEEG